MATTPRVATTADALIDQPINDPQAVDPPLTLDEGALEHGEAGKTSEDHLKDSTAVKDDYYREWPHRTYWDRDDVEDCCSNPNMERWEEMRYWQMGDKPTGTTPEALPVTSRGKYDNSGRRERRDKRYLAQMIAHLLGCTKHQRKRVTGLMTRLDVSRLGAHSDNITASIAVTSIVTEERRQYAEWSYTTHREDESTLLRKPTVIEKTPEFEQLCEEHGIKPSGVKTAKESVRKQLGFE